MSLTLPLTLSKVSAQLAVCADASSATVGSDKGSLHQYKHGTAAEDGKAMRFMVRVRVRVGLGSKGEGEG